MAGGIKAVAEGAIRIARYPLARVARHLVRWLSYPTNNVWHLATCIIAVRDPITGMTYLAPPSPVPFPYVVIDRDMPAPMEEPGLAASETMVPSSATAGRDVAHERQWQSPRRLWRPRGWTASPAAHSACRSVAARPTKQQSSIPVSPEL